MPTLFDVTRNLIILQYLTDTFSEGFLGGQLCTPELIVHTGGDNPLSSLRTGVLPDVASSSYM